MIMQWSNCRGTRGNGVPLPFLAEERRSPSLHDDSYLQHKQQKKNVRQMHDLKLPLLLIGVNLSHAFCNL